MKRAMAPVEISKIRFCGGKIAELFAAREITTMGEIQSLDLEYLV